MRQLSVLLFGLVSAIFLFCQPLSAESVIEHPYAILHLDTPSDSTVVTTALATTRAQLITRLQDSLSYRPRVYVVTSAARFDSLLGGKFPDWGAAAALPEEGLIIIKSPAAFNLTKSLEELVRHEYSHLALAHKLGFRVAPRWFDEGLAMLVSTEWGWEDNLAMSRAVLFGQTVPLAEIDMVNRFPEGKAHVAYAESYLAVKYLYDNYLVNGVMIFLTALSAGETIDSALVKSTGSTYAGFEKEYQLWLKERYTITNLFMDTIYFWMFLAIVLIVGVILSYRRRRSVYKRWEKEEELESKDFDYGDPDNPEQADDDEPWRQ